MGVFKLFSGGSQQSSLPNPNPKNYSIMRSKSIGKYLIVEIKYHDCTNYEGRKIMLYDCTIDELMRQKIIDPHFCDNKKYLSPIARFEPSKRGWDVSAATAKALALIEGLKVKGE